LQLDRSARLFSPPSGIFGDLEPPVAADGRQLAFMRNYGASRSNVFVADLVTGNLRQVTQDAADVL
jgi:Tol biopolymer transport system component